MLSIFLHATVFRDFESAVAQEMDKAMRSMEVQKE